MTQKSTSNSRKNYTDSDSLIESFVKEILDETHPCMTPQIWKTISFLVNVLVGEHKILKILVILDCKNLSLKKQI